MQYKSYNIWSCHTIIYLISIFLKINDFEPKILEQARRFSDEWIRPPDDITTSSITTNWSLSQ